MANIDDLSEVTPLREVPRPPEHCGVPMRRMTGFTATGGTRPTYVCAKECGAQIKGEEVKA